MGIHERDIEEMAEGCEKGTWNKASFPIAGDRYNAGSTALAVAVELLKRNEGAKGIELVERLQQEVSYAEDCGA